MTINLINNRKYIGKHNGSPDDSYLGSGRLLKHAISKYGRNNFHRVVLEYANDEFELERLEVDWITRLEAVHSNEYYNVALGGTGGDTLCNLSEEDLKNRSEKIKSTFSAYTEEQRKRNSINRSKSAKRACSDDVINRRVKKFKETHDQKPREQIIKQYEGRRGGNGYQARRVVTPLGTFVCATEAAKLHGVHIQTILNRCKNANFPDWRFYSDE